MTETVSDEALGMLLRDARKGRAGAAQAYARELRRRANEGKLITKREKAEEAKRRATTSAYLLSREGTGQLPLPPVLYPETWVAHLDRLDGCSCLKCSAHARAILEELQR